ncbi:MAG: hypothetical protein WDN50_00610 [Bradyrhizobium sp.]
MLIGDHPLDAFNDRAEIVGQHGLLEQAEQDHEQRAVDGRHVRQFPPLRQLRQQIARPA